MKWIYGKQDWKSFERGQENCYLLTNGLGGFSSATMIGSVSRNDHALLMACVHAPNHRYNMVHRLSEQVTLEGDSHMISSQEFADGTREDGWRYLEEFSYEDTPVWRFLVEGVQVRKEISVEQGTNTAAVCYEITNRSSRMCDFTVTPFFQFTPKGSEPKPSQVFEREEGCVRSNGLSLYFWTDAEVKEIPEISEVYFYSYDDCDGRRPTGLAKANHRICKTVNPGEKCRLELVYSMETTEKKAASILAGHRAYRKKLEELAGFSSELAAFLAKSANQFVSRRESTDGETILAGFPFFEDWGRDTMIALPGICISTRQYGTAREILRTFAAYEKDGLMPNLFPEGGEAPLYNMVDAALLFIN